ncbi:hypothetical protein B7O87_09280 [Cylindrospermopsis raciborskii CENA303]|uniref:Methyltransferase n=1 Tax=Cylindrospermopsis raciborskii CENA303 TaxID=1170769 RepID=A0A1X4G6D8_9CYAN|nr:hypothetical protein [Cylindrospermopsis raciborskii]OSO90602.1 hypothetical protein B7O87_09280 [Cylindrospermopsis raciborskii CENA303]
MKHMVLKLFTPILDRYRLVLKRVHDLEIVQNTLLFDETWVNDPTKFLNGQLQRQSIVLQLRQAFDFSIIIETGSFIGNTTGWFAELWGGEKIHSCEIDPRFHALSQIRCANMNISFFMGDSRSFLENLRNSDISQIAFFYLDAHWGNDLPLKQELMIIKEKWPCSVVMIDDFEVPGDIGYSYDNYGPGKALTFQEFSPFFLENKFYVYSPTVKSQDESGFRRGMVLLTLDPAISKVIDDIPSLYRHYHH